MTDSDRLRQLAGVSPSHQTVIPTALRLIGESIQQAIDWTQDTLQITRPQAEEVLFGLLKRQQVMESGIGFLLRESEDEEEMRRHLHHAKAHARARGHRRGHIRSQRRWKKVRPDLRPDIDDEDATNDR